MYPLIYHLTIDEYFPNEEFEPHLFRHLDAAGPRSRRSSALRRLGTAVLRAVRLGRAPTEVGVRPPARGPEPAIRWS
jgi:hypothetical protein